MPTALRLQAAVALFPVFATDCPGLLEIVPATLTSRNVFIFFAVARILLQAVVDLIPGNLRPDVNVLRLTPNRIFCEWPILRMIKRAQQDPHIWIAVIENTIGEPHSAQKPLRAKALER